MKGHDHCHLSWAGLIILPYAIVFVFLNPRVSACLSLQDLDGLFEDSQAPVARAPEASSPDGEVGEKSAPNDFWREERRG